MGSEVRISLTSGFDPRGMREASHSLDELNAKLNKSNKWQLEINADLSRAIHRYAEGMAVDYGKAADKGAASAVLSARQIEEAWRKAMAKPAEEAAKGFGKMESIANGALNGIGGKFKQLGAEFMRGGIWGVAANALVGAFSWAWDKLKEASERAAKRMERAFQDSLAAIKENASEVESAFERSMSAIDKNISRFDAMTNSVKELTKAEIELARQTAIANGMDKGDADAAASDLNAQLDYEMERKRLENIMAMEQKRVDDAERAEAETAEAVKKATAEKAAAEADLQKKRDEYVRRHSQAEGSTYAAGMIGGAVITHTVTAEEARRSRENAALDFEGSEEGKKAAERVKQLKDALAGIKTDEKALAAADEARATIERTRDAIDALETRRAARELEVQNEIAAKVEKDAEAKAEAERQEAEKAAAEEIRLAERTAAEQARLDAERYRERERMERELAQKRIADLRDELAVRQKEESEAASRQSAAHGSLSTAWGWYRDQSKMQGVIDEHKAQAAAEVQWQKDFEHLKTWRRDWRTAEFGSLSASDEAVRQVAFAKEEKAAADRAVIETAENTRNLAEKLDELLQIKG